MKNIIIDKNMMTQRNHKLLPSNILTSQLWTYFFKLISSLAPTIAYALRHWYCDDFVSEITDSFRPPAEIQGTSQLIC